MAEERPGATQCKEPLWCSGKILAEGEALTAEAPGAGGGTGIAPHPARSGHSAPFCGQMDWHSSCIGRSATNLITLLVLLASGFLLLQGGGDGGRERERLSHPQ